MDRAEREAPVRHRHPLRWVLLGVALVYAAACIISALDRVSAGNPAAFRQVPEAFRARAHAAHARLLLQAEDGAAAQAAAAKAVVSRPIDAGGPSLLGGALLQQGKAADAGAAFRVAAMGGWRDPLTQIYWADMSARMGEWDLAAARVDAVLRGRPTLEEANAIRAIVENTPEGREALAKKLAEKPGWTLPYVSVDDSVPIETVLMRGEIMTRAGRISGPAGCDLLATLTRNLLRRGEGIAAVRLWQVHCPQSPAIARAGAIPLSGDAGSDPFGWSVNAEGETSVDIPSRSGDPIVARNRAGGTRLIATRPVLVDGGSAILRVRARGSEDQKVDAVLSLDCTDPVRPPFGEGASRTVSLGDCPVKTLGLWLPPRSGDVRIEMVEVALSGQP